jgi:hypothetical protein
MVDDPALSSTGKDSSGIDKLPFVPPQTAPPTGGGAICGIGEKFAANLVTGTGSLTIPIAVSPGRSGFGPQLSLSYDSGAANGAFGMGWSLSLPAITRKTDKGLPQYHDDEESDVFAECERNCHTVKRHRSRSVRTFPRTELVGKRPQELI